MLTTAGVSVEGQAMIIDFGNRTFESEGSAEGIFFTVYEGDEWIKLKVVDSSGDVTIVNE